jgi:hypothetical protein
VRIFVAVTLALTLTACGSSQQAAQQAAQQRALQDSTADCLARESIAVAPQPTDLETATLAVMARCDYPAVIERSMLAEHPTERQVHS